MYDVIVVGARCAGSPLAMLLARQGHRVLVVDRNSFPSDTVSTHYILQLGIARLRDWGLLDKLAASGATPIRRLNFSSTLSGFAEIDGVTATYAPRRTVLDALLVDAARAAGAEVLEKFTVTDLVWREGRVAGVRGSSAGGREQEFRADFVVGADGRNSTVGNLVDAEYHHVVPPSGFFAYNYYDGLDWGWQIRASSDRQWFGAWPTNDNQHVVAVMRRLDRFADFRADVEGNFHQVFDQIAPDFGARLRDCGSRAERFRVMRYSENYYRRSAGPGWALVGDAGYHKDPYTGAGISDALVYAELLADHLHAGLSGAQPIDEAVRDYERQRDKRSAPYYEFTHTLAELALPPLYRAAFGAAAGSELGRAQYFTLIGGGLDATEFFGRDNLRVLYDAAGTPAAERVFATQS